MLDAGDGSAVISNLMQLLHHIYQPLIENLLFFADDGPDRKAVYEEILIAIHSLSSSLKGSITPFDILHNNFNYVINVML